MEELIKVETSENGELLVSGRELHEFLEIGTRYDTWFSRMKDYGFEENIDFVLVDQRKSINNPKNPFTVRSNHMIKLRVAKTLCILNNKSKESSILYKYFCNFNNEDVFVHKQERKEYIFSELLEEVTGIRWYKQYPIDKGKYRLDFYLPSVLIVEFDEKYHEFKNDQDLERLEYCREWLNEYGEFEEYDKNWRIPVIRVKEGEEFSGLNRIIKHLVGFGVINDDNYNLEPCDIGNKPLHNGIMFVRN